MNKKALKLQSHKPKSKRKSSTSSSSNSDSDEWVEKVNKPQESNHREDWMAMTGMLKTYTKDDIRPKQDKDKKHIDSYNPANCSRELNPYWKNGGTGLPQTSESFRKSKAFVRPNDEDDYYRKHSITKSHSQIQYSDDKSFYSSKGSTSRSTSKGFVKPCSNDDDYYKSHKSLQSNSPEAHSNKDSYEKYNDRRSHDKKSYSTSRNWRKESEREKHSTKEESPEHKGMLKYEDTMSGEVKNNTSHAKSNVKAQSQQDSKDSKYLSDEKMNKLAAKIVKAEILGDDKLVEKLKTKLEDARLYRKQNPDAGREEEDDRVMLISSSSTGNSRPLTCGQKGDPRSKGSKRKAETHVSGERVKYFGNDDKYDLKEMFQEEKYGTNYDNDAELAKITSKHKNRNDDIEDIFMDQISKNRNAAKDSESEKQRSINQHVKMTKSLEGCEYCLDSKNMLKHLMVTMGSKVYVALPSRKSLVDDECLITTIQHSTCVTSIDEDVWEEILNYRNALTQFYNSKNKDILFYETATKLHKYPHLVIHCVPLPRDVGDMAAIYFKKALLECEAEWSMNKKVVDLKGKSIRKGIPRGLPYFWIDFGMDPGFAHVIEDQQLFPRSFAEEIIGGILDLDHSLWKKPRKEHGDIQRKKVVQFIKEWKPFEPTKT